MRGIVPSLTGIFSPRTSSRAILARNFQHQCRMRYSSSTDENKKDGEDSNSNEEKDQSHKPTPEKKKPEGVVLGFQELLDKYGEVGSQAGRKRPKETSAAKGAGDAWNTAVSEEEWPEEYVKPVIRKPPKVRKLPAMEERARLIRRGRFKDLVPVSWDKDLATRPLLLTFDAFGTLFRPRQSIEIQYCEIAEAHGIELSRSDVLKSFQTAYKAFSASHPNYGKESGIDPESWWFHVIRNTLQPLIPPDIQISRELLEALYARFASCDGYKLFGDVAPLLKLLGTSYSVSNWAPQRTVLGILSNSDPRVRSIIQSFAISITPSLFPPRYTPFNEHSLYKFGPAYFGFATLSYEAGFAKPDKGIYDAAIRDAQYMLERMAFTAKTTRTGYRLLRDVRKEFHVMHVGDELGKDIIPALKCGWDAVLLDRRAEENVGEMEIEVVIEEGDYIYEREAEKLRVAEDLSTDELTPDGESNYQAAKDIVEGLPLLEDCLEVTDVSALDGQPCHQVTKEVAEELSPVEGLPTDDKASDVGPAQQPAVESPGHYSNPNVEPIQEAQIASEYPYNPAPQGETVHTAEQSLTDGSNLARDANNVSDPAAISSVAFENLLQNNQPSTSQSPVQDAISQSEDPQPQTQQLDSQPQPHPSPLNPLSNPIPPPKLQTRPPIIKTFRVPVINNLLALQQLVTKSRFETQDETGRWKPAQAPVYVDGKPWQRHREVIKKRKGSSRKNFMGRRTVRHPGGEEYETLAMYI